MGAMRTAHKYDNYDGQDCSWSHDGILKFVNGQARNTGFRCSVCFR